MSRREKDFTIQGAPLRPRHTLFRNFTWTGAAVKDWEWVWAALWNCGVQWEWQNRDRYARRRGEEFIYFAVHNDADRLDMAIPLPGLHVIHQMADHLLDKDIDDVHANEATNLIRKWMVDYVE